MHEDQVALGDDPLDEDLGLGVGGLHTGHRPLERGRAVGQLGAVLDQLEGHTSIAVALEKDNVLRTSRPRR
jgi:hypothetical protein